jgi:hypothetical protein
MGDPLVQPAALPQDSPSQFLILLFKILARIHLFRSCDIRMSHNFQRSMYPPLRVGFKPINQTLVAPDCLDIGRSRTIEEACHR